MQIDVAYAIWPRNIDWNALFQFVAEFASKRKFSPLNTSIRVTLDRHESRTAGTLEEFQKLTKVVGNIDSLSAQQQFQHSKSSGLLSVFVYRQGNTIQITVDSNDADIVILLSEQLKNEFGLQKAPVPSADKERALYLQPTVFLGRHFNPRAAKLAHRLKELLHVIGMRVTQGDSYESRAIPDKVKKLIEANDIYIGLVTENPEHDWLTAESAYSHGQKRHVILLVQREVKFNPTISGRDLEQIRFEDDRIEEAFVPLLMEFRKIGIRF